MSLRHVVGGRNSHIVKHKFFSGFFRRQGVFSQSTVGGGIVRGCGGEKGLGHLSHPCPTGIYSL